jgi:hypothetical protein
VDELAFFDLSEIGAQEGQAVPTVCYVATLDAGMLTSPPDGTETCTDVVPETYGACSYDGGVAGAPPELGAPRPLRLGGRLTKLGRNRRAAFNRVREDDEECMAGAIARSLDWLNREYRLGVNKTAQQLQRELVEAGTAIGKETGQTNAEVEGRRLRNKQAYTDRVFGGRIVTKTWDAGANVDTPPGMTESTEDLATWLRREWETEDVELIYTNGDEAHAVTIVEVVEDSFGNFKVKFRDDQYQNDPSGPGDSREKPAWVFKQNGVWHFFGLQFTIRFAVSESVTPE